MTQGAYPPPKKPPLSGADLSISITALVLTVLMGGAGAVFGLFSLAFLDYCPPETCSAEGAATAVMSALLIAGVVGLAGLTLTVIQFARRKPGWPFAVATLVACGIVLVFGAFGYFTAVGG